MGRERVVRRQLLGHLLRQRRLQPTLHVDRRELAHARAAGSSAISSFSTFRSACLGIRLRMHGHVLARRHRHRACHTAPRCRTAGSSRWSRAGRGHADDEARGGDDAVVRAKHRGAQPADVARAVMLFVVPWFLPCGARYSGKQRRRRGRRRRIDSTHRLAGRTGAFVRTAAVTPRAELSEVVDRRNTRPPAARSPRRRGSGRHPPGDSRARGRSAAPPPS